MARISGVDIPKGKQIAYSLCYVHGVGFNTAIKICKKSKVNSDIRVKDLTEKQIISIRDSIENLGLIVEGNLRSLNAMNIKRLKDIGSYRGVRHRKSLPVNGQRTKTNSRTRKGRKRTIGLGRKAI